MKRLIIALVLLCVIIVILITGKHYVTGNVKAIETNLTVCVKNYENRNYVSATDTACELERIWVENEDKLSVFVNKGILEEIGVSIARIKSCAKYQNDDFYPECDTLYVLLTHMKNDENFPFLGVF